MGKGPLRSCGWVARAGCGGLSPYTVTLAQPRRFPVPMEPTSLWGRTDPAPSPECDGCCMDPAPPPLCVLWGAAAVPQSSAPPPPKPCPGLQQPLCCLDPHTGDPPPASPSPQGWSSHRCSPDTPASHTCRTNTAPHAQLLHDGGHPQTPSSWERGPQPPPPKDQVLTSALAPAFLHAADPFPSRPQATQFIPKGPALC